MIFEVAKYLVYLVLLGVPCVVLFLRGAKYGASPQRSVSGALRSAIAWSAISCWSLVVLVSGHGGAAVIPLPSWCAFAWAALEGFPAHFVAFPHFAITPAIPIGIFLLAVIWGRWRATTSVAP